MVEDEEPAASGAFDSVVGRVEAQLARGRPSGAVEAPEREVVPDRPGVRGRGFRAGVMLGVLCSIIVVQLWLSLALARLAANRPDPPSVSKWVDVVSSGAWRWGMLAMMLLLAGSAYKLSGRGKRWPMVSALVTTLVVLGLTAYAVSYRVNELTSGNRIVPSGSMWTIGFNEIRPSDRPRSSPNRSDTKA